MICPKCGKENSEDAAFCGECGYDFSSDNIMNALDNGDSESEKPSSKKEKRRSKKEKDKRNNGENTDNKKSKKTKVKVILVAVAVIIVVIAVAVLVLFFSSTEGEKVLNNIPIGRDVAYAESKTGRNFTTVSKYAAVEDIAAFDNICEADSGLRVEGIQYPEWAVTISLAEDKTINKVVYYDFSQLQKNWKGHHSNDEIPLARIEYGMSEKSVERAMGFKPYTIIKEVDNNVTYVYRYYYSDDVTGNDVVCNYSVVFDDANGSVKDVYVSIVDYASVIINAD